MTGLIIGWFETYGFIRPDDGGPDVFIRDDLFRKGDRVRYTAVANPRRPGQMLAVDVERIATARVARGLRVADRPTTTNWRSFGSRGSGRRAA